MNRSRLLRAPRQVLTGVMLCALAACVTAPTASAAFPGQGFLPHNRAWEMVSPADKNGGHALPDARRTRAAVDGNAIGYISLAAFGDAVGSGIATDYMAVRSTNPDPGHSGWATHAITPAVEPQTFAGIFGSLEPLYVGEFTDDLQRGVFSSNSPLTEEPGVFTGVGGALNLYRRTDLRSPGTGSYELLTACPRCLETGEPLPPLSGESKDFRMRPELAGASPDLERLVFESQQRLTSDAPETSDDEERLFESEAGEVRLAGKIPAGSAGECDDEGGPACIAAAVSVGGSGSHAYTRLTPHTVSDGSDGHRRVFFTVPTDETGTVIDPDGRAGNLYVRTDATTTAKLNLSERTSADAFAPAKYNDATPDGTRVYFTTTQALTDDAPADGKTKLYSYDTTRPSGEPDNLTLVGADRESEDDGEVLGLIGASPDGAYAYFIAAGQLLDGEPLLIGGQHVIYLWHGGELRTVGRISDFGESTFMELVTISPNADLAPRQARLDADGTRLLFVSREGSGLTGHDHGVCAPGSAAPGCPELYLYDAVADTLRCASCRPGGGPSAPNGNEASTYVRRFTGGTNPAHHETRALSADGRYVFFSTGEKLVPEDTNGTSDAYLYDSLTEEQRLLSSGEDGSPSWFLDATPDGSDVFFATRERLSRWDVGDDYDIYDARVGGGFPEPPTPPPGCVGDGCQPAPFSNIRITPSSSGFRGPGDPKAGRPRPRCPKAKRRVRAKGGKSRCVRKSRKRDAKRNRGAGR